MVRTSSAVEFPQGVEVVRGDLTAPETLDACLDGVDAVFLVWTAPPATVADVIERIARGVRRIVFLSAPLKTPHPLFQSSLPNVVSRLAEDLERRIEASGLEWTFLRPGMLASNALNWWAPQIRAGDVVRWPYMDVPTTPIDERDIAAVGVRALTEDGHAGREYLITGPESLTHRDQIETIGRALGRPLRAEEMTPVEAGEELSTILPPVALKMLLTAWGAAVGHPAFQTATVQEMTGAPARTFFQWACDHSAAFHA
jgi:uncharacterized protein YbjT (DUF2867 family)